MKDFITAHPMVAGVVIWFCLATCAVYFNYACSKVSNPSRKSFKETP